MNMANGSRTIKHHPAPPPSPKVLHFPRSRRTRRKQNRITASHHCHQNGPSLLLMRQKYECQKGALGNLFDRENDDPPSTHGPAPSVSHAGSPASGRRERVEEDDCEEYFNGAGGGTGGFEEEKWRFQADVLRAECKLLRMERELALKKLEKNRVNMERTLRSVVQTLLSGRKKISEGKNVNEVLDEEIEDLADKLVELQKKCSRNKEDCEVQNSSNFDKKDCFLQRRLENLRGLSNENSGKDSQEVAEPRFCFDVSHQVDTESKIFNWKTEDKPSDEKMEGLSMGTSKRFEKEHKSTLPFTANNSLASSASTSKRIESELPNFSTRQLHQESVIVHENKCTGRCKAIVRRIVEQVRAETDQWAQMQEMLAQVRGEMEELQASRDFWENRAYNLDHEIRSLRHIVKEWKEKATIYEKEANELRLECSTLKEQIEVPLRKQLGKEKNIRLVKKGQVEEKERNYENALEEDEKKGGLPVPLSLGKQLAKEKRNFLRHLKENRHNGDRKREGPTSRRRNKLGSARFGILDPNRSPLMDISSLSPLTRQISRSAFFGFRSPESSRVRGSFKKNH